MGPSSSAIGEKIRLLRKERGWTLQELSGRAGISLSALSKVETAQVAPTFDTLLKIAKGLEIAFDTLLVQDNPAGAEPSPRGGGRLVVTKKADAAGFSTGMYDYEVHANALLKKHMTPLIMVVKSRSIDDETSWSMHDGEEFIYVISGQIALHTEFYEAVSLATGDSAYIDSGMAHMMLNTGEGEAVIASICYGPVVNEPFLTPAGVGSATSPLAAKLRENL